MRKLASFIAIALLACTTYRDHLQRGQRLYQENEFDRALAIWRTLEPDMNSLSWEEQARYSYLRGMTDYRLGFKQDARHWLAIAKAINSEHPGGLEGDWPDRTETALNELNKDVFGLAAESSDSESVEHVVDTSEDLGRSTQEPTNAPPAAAPGGTAACRSEADCASEEVCMRGKCLAK